MSQKQTNTEEVKINKPVLLMGKKNYIILIVGLLIIATGFLLMSGGATTDPNVFNEDIFSFRRIRLAPIIVLTGFGVVFYSIFFIQK